MKTISIDISEQLLSETEVLIQKLNTNRNQYLNEAIQFYNQYQKQLFLEEQNRNEARLIARNSPELLNKSDKIINHS